MRLIQWYKQRASTKRQIKEFKAFVNGYGWAWGAYRFGHMTITDIQNKASDEHPFDKGAHRAIDDIVESGL